MAGFHDLSLTAGDTLFREHDAVDAAYLVVSGTLEVTVGRPDGDVTISTIGAGEMVGELAILTSGRRSVTATATSDCVLHRIDGEQFTRRLFEADPVIRMTMETLLHRLEHTTRLIESSTGVTSGFSSCSSRLSGAALESLKLESDIVDAMHRNEMSVHYQPIVHLQTGMLCGFEALARWNHPERGEMAPDDFIPTANESALICQITGFALRQVCADLPVMRGACLRNVENVANVVASVNVTGRDLETGNLIDDLCDITSANGLEPDAITLEISEGSLMRDPAMAHRVLKQLREIGTGVAVDDFGTGYSNVSHLTRLPATSLKIDRSFVSNVSVTSQNARIIKAIQNIARDLQMTVVAEGIETADDLAFVRERGCDFGQGFHFARPMPLNDVIRFIEAWDKRTMDTHGRGAATSRSVA